MPGRSILHLRLADRADPGAREPDSRALTDFCRRTTPVWEINSSGAFLELTGTERLYGRGIDGSARVGLLARRAAGVRGGGAGPSRLAARLASRAAVRAGGGVLVVLPDQVAAFLAPFPVTCLAVGTSLGHRLAQLGIRTLGDLQVVPPALLRSVFGAAAAGLVDEAWGREVTPRPGHDPDQCGDSSLSLVVGVRLARPALSAGVTAAMRRGLAVRALTVCAGGPAAGRRWRLRAQRPEGRPDDAQVRGLGQAGWKSWFRLVDELWSRLPRRRQGVVGLELWSAKQGAAGPRQGGLFVADEADGRLADAVRRSRAGSGPGVAPGCEELLVGRGAEWYGPAAGNPTGRRGLVDGGGHGR